MNRWGGAVCEAVALISYEPNADRIIGVLFVGMIARLAQALPSSADSPVRRHVGPILHTMNRWRWSITMLQFAADTAMTTRSTSWCAWGGEFYKNKAFHVIYLTLAVIAGGSPSHHRDARGKRQIWSPLLGIRQQQVEEAGTCLQGGRVQPTNGADVPVSSLRFEGVAAGVRAKLTVLRGPKNNPSDRANTSKTPETTCRM
ncbi:hypothetical protein F5Y14DRAFT_333422 [Nemania sp. NC0429]|nr:hypothetical protein F5Y14DRAFT_333422 [Nemania sp. NC0429]